MFLALSERACFDALHIRARREEIRSVNPLGFAFLFITFTSP